MSEPVILGIDLGTTNSLGAYISPSGPILVRDSTGSALVPSVIAFSPDGGIMVGSEARTHAVENPLTTIYSVKRLLGRGIDDIQADLKFLPYPIVPAAHETVSVQVAGKAITPQELSAMILREIKTRAEAELAQEIAQAVITVPAYFDDAQRQATRDAGRIAGLEVRRIVNEPTAAALAYGLGRKRDETIAVYDLGGATEGLELRCHPLGPLLLPERGCGNSAQLEMLLIDPPLPAGKPFQAFAHTIGCGQISDRPQPGLVQNITCVGPGHRFTV